MDLESVPTAAVIYVGDLPRMSQFYEGCFDWSVVDEGHCYRGMQSRAGLVTFVETADAQVGTSPAPRRSGTAIKLVVEVDSIDDATRDIVSSGGRVDPADRAWTFRGMTHRDAIDPEGNVLQLVQAAP